MSLRRRVMLGLIVVAVVLGGAGIAIAGTMRSYLVKGLDSRLSSVSIPRVFRAGGPGNFGVPDQTRQFSDLAFVVTGPDGVVLFATPPSLGANTEPLPKVDGLVPFSAGGPNVRYASVGPATGDGPHYRVRAVRLPSAGSPGHYILSPSGADVGYVMLAVSLQPTERTFHHIVFVEILASIGVLGSLALSGWWLLRQGVRPLDKIAAAADRIAEGDLTHRVPVDDTRTEAGRLGRALNRMLGEIESSFRRKEESEDRLKRFVGDAGHELRTPLTSIRGYADLYRQGGLNDPDRLRDAMGRLESEAARMGRLVDDLLLLARLDEGRPLERAPVDVSAIARDAVSDARVADPSRPISLDAAPTAIVMGDGDRIHQVMANLLANTRVHTPPGSPVEVSVSRSNEHVTVAVRDQGPGLDPDTADKVFERFYRADPARARVSGGTGLGLAIVRAVAEAHGGHATVESRPGAGATFIVTLPIARTLPPPHDGGHLPLPSEALIPALSYVET